MKKGILNKIALIAVCSLTANAYAVAPGVYFGVMAGSSSTSKKTVQAQVRNSAATTPVALNTNNKFGARLFLGYKINTYAGWETGLTYFPTYTYTNTNNVTTCGNPTTGVRGFDFTVKGTLPLGSSFDVFGRAGIFISGASLSGTLNPSGTTACGAPKTQVNYAPTFSLGASYDLNQNWVTDLSYNYLSVGSAPVSPISFLALGISYHFVDKYCGQFLC